MTPARLVARAPLELEEHGDTAYEVGRYTMSGTEGKTIDIGKYVVIWKREGGQWKYHRDIGNTSMGRSRWSQSEGGT